MVLVILAFIVIVYISIGLLYNNLNKLLTGKGTILAWIPICNTYLLGKLTVNKLVGWLLVVGLFLTGTVNITINGESKVYSILSENMRSTLSNVYDLVVFVLFITAIVKYVNLSKSAKAQPTIPTQPQMMPQQPVQNNEQNNNMM